MNPAALLTHKARASCTRSPREGASAALGIWSVDLAAPSPPIQFDRIIAATAKIHRLTLITRDANITDSGAVDTLW